MAFVPSAKLIAKKRGINVGSLIDILSYRRPYDSEGEQEFLAVVLDNVDGMIVDDFGNRYLRIPKSDGSASDVLWSCHTDTVHRSIKNGVVRQNIKWDGAGNILSLNEGKAGQCLGADDGAGLWLMLEMIENGIPGLYIFHRGEEVGGKGSRWIEKNTPELLDGINYAIAFDRKDLSSIITHQGGRRCCSDAFGKALGEAISRIDGLKMRLDTGGSFTDTAVYTDLVPECTNVSVGYYSQHGPRETLDVRHMIKLRDALLQIDPDTDFVVVRKAGELESLWQSYKWTAPKKATTPAALRSEQDQKAWQGALISDEEAYEQWMMDRYGPSITPEQPDSSDERSTPVFQSLLRMIKEYPEIAAEMFLELGLDHWDIADRVMHGDDLSGGLSNPDADLAGEITDAEISCQNCGTCVPSDMTDDDMLCPFCFAPLGHEMEHALSVADRVTALLEDHTNE